jgi:splicing factor 3B subunit 2
MQRYGPPPSYPHLSIPGLNAPLPSGGSYGYHPGGFGKPPVDAFGRPLYGGNPFDPPGSGKKQDDAKEFVTSDGKTVAKTHWGSLPTGDFQFGRDDEEEESEDESSSQDEDMGESDAEEDTTVADGIASVLPPPTTSAATAPQDLRKQSAGDETPAPDSAPKRLYQVLETKAASDGSTSQQDGVFQSDIQYVVPGGVSQAAAVPEGAESVLSKAVAPGEATARKRKHNADDEDTIDKNFKF